MSYKYRSLIKPLAVRKTLPDLLPAEEPFFCMESKDLEGYPGHFYLGYIRKPRLLHPTRGDAMVTHPYDELLIFAGTNPKDILYLGAEVSVVLGEERLEYAFDESSVVIIPKGLPHGPVRIRKLDSPIIHVALADALEHKTDIKVAGKETSKGEKYKRLVKRLMTSKSAYETIIPLGPVKIDERGVMDLRAIGPGEAYQMLQMHPEDLEGVNISFSFELCGTPGSWMTTKLAHVHPEPELLIAMSLDPNDLKSLGASLEFWFGAEREVYVIDRPSVITIPRPWIAHTPLVTQRVDRPFAFMLVFPGSYMQAGFVETGFDVY
ncbi:MAG: hypothetical protein RMJ15_08335 [Nitrososphaerota archaeon]|nr:hypothetical protein [Candidatus Bathyarchaeota archaeon]MDW8023725.1 hypothetical protein [Nitrososphaerota archaeon]